MRGAPIEVAQQLVQTSTYPAQTGRANGLIDAIRASLDVIASAAARLENLAALQHVRGDSHFGRHNYFNLGESQRAMGNARDALESAKRSIELLEESPGAAESLRRADIAAWAHLHLGLRRTAGGNSVRTTRNK